ncbi:MAG: histidine phosphatase family protein [Chloroflexota bacterium]|nr:histidine phosphatase family protein [Dehalococcoidia bacterium]MDW8255034.1 histidine phosphatase family protein [Chloroflexota bacterium]
MKLLCVRHGESVWNAEGRTQGQADVALSERGRQQAAAIAGRLERVPIGAVFSSDLVRAWETALPIAAAHGAPLVPVPALRERHLGAFQGLTFEEIVARFPDLWEAVFRGDGRPPGGETRAEVGARVRCFLRELRAAPPAETVVLVGHGGSLRAAFAELLGLPQEEGWRFRVDNGSLTIFALYPEGAVAEVLNDTCHLDGGRSPEW